ncbi:MAG: chromate efflux transporter [Acidiferrobacterales bacterium]
MHTERISLSNLAWTFLKVGATAFGGFMALISIVENIVVERRRLLSHEDMLDGISLASTLPGPVAVNVVAYVGYRLRGGAGALVAASAVILPSFVLITVLSFVYFRWGQIPAMQKLFMGFIPAVTAIIINTAWGMSCKTISTLRETAILFFAALVLLTVGGFFSTIAVIGGAGFVGWFLFYKESGTTDRSTSKTLATQKSKLSFLAVAPFFVVPLGGLSAGLLTKLFLTFAGMSVMLFGGGYVFIPMIQEVVVNGNGWVTQTEFIDGIAMGQITPGPILISATFIGFKVAGLAGALVATIGIFLPPALIMVAATNGLERIKHSSRLRAVLRGVRPAVIGMIFAAAVVIGDTATANGLSLLIFVIALAALMHLKLDVIWVIPVAGLFGLAAY